MTPPANVLSLLPAAGLALLAACGTPTPLRPASAETQARVETLTRRHPCSNGIASALDSAQIAPSSVGQILVRENRPLPDESGSPISFTVSVLRTEGASRILNLDFTCRPTSIANEGGVSDGLRFTN